MLSRWLAASALAAGLLCSACAGGRLKVPGEDMVRTRNEAVDAFTRAQRYESEGNYTSALACYEEAMACDELYESAYYKTGRCYALLRDWERARQVFTDIAVMDPANTTIQESLAYVYVMEGDYSSALQLYAELTEGNPYSASLLKNYIKVLAADGQKSRASQEFARFQSSFPDEVDTIKELYQVVAAP